MIKLLISLWLFHTIPINGICQDQGTKDGTSVNFYGKHYHKPQFMGGFNGIDSFVKKNIRYPDAARENNIEGTAIIRFCVEENGSITNVAIIQDLEGGCGNEAKRVVQNMPSWVAATYKKKPVCTIETLPIVFKLEQ